jgi:hypothetical protein
MAESSELDARQARSMAVEVILAPAAEKGVVT